MANYGQVLSLVFSCLQRESYYADLMSKNEQGRMGDQDAEPVSPIGYIAAHRVHSRLEATCSSR